MWVVRAAVAATVLALLGLLVWDLAHNKGGVATKVDKGQTVAAPVLALPRLGSAGRLSLASFRGRVVVLNFWASWCGPCKDEAATLTAGAARWRDKGVTFLGVDSEDLSGNALAWMKRYGVDYPVIRSGDDSAKSAWGVSGYPETFFVDRRGRVVPPHVNGPITRALLDDAIRKALAS